MCSDITNFCLDAIDGTALGVLLEAVLLVYSFVGIAIVADGYLATSLEVLCERWKIPEDVAGASFLALGSAAPEIVINVVATIKIALSAEEATQEAEMATGLGVGSIMGSGMMAFTLIPGLCGLVVPEPMSLTRRPVARDTLSYVVSMVALLSFMADGAVSAAEAWSLVALYGCYLALVVFSPMVRQRLLRAYSSSYVGAGDLAEKLAPTTGHTPPAGEEEEDDDDDEAPPTGVYGALAGLAAVGLAPLRLAIEGSIPSCEGDAAEGVVYGRTLLLSFAWLTTLSALLSAVIERWGTLLGISTAVMGMYVVAVGAQIPDTIQAIAVARKGHGSMAVASATGSQVMNILIGLGLPWFILAASGRPIVVHGHAALRVMGLYQLGCVGVYAALVLLPTWTTWGRRGRATLGKCKGAALIAAYAVVIYAYITVGGGGAAAADDAQSPGAR